MKYMRRRFKWLVFAVLGACVALPFLYLGPSLGFRHSPEILDSLRLDDGSRLCLVREPNGKGLGSRMTELYRIYPDESETSTLLAFKDPYWWLGKLRKSADAKSVEIRVWGSVDSRFDIASGETIKVDGNQSLPITIRRHSGSSVAEHFRVKLY
jgi:hypothetical protein